METTLCTYSCSYLSINNNGRIHILKVIQVEQPFDLDCLILYIMAGDLTIYEKVILKWILNKTM